ncbi:hypothetical protein GCM10022221_78580 [Actinocorallia aurea]
MSDPEPPSTDPGGDFRRRRYAGAIIALSAVVIGLCTVAGESLIPRTLPPQDARGWLSFLAAVVLFTAVFAATAVITGFLDSITRILARRSLRERLAALRLARVGGAAVFIAVVAAVMWQLVDPAKLVKDTEIGGLDISEYCGSYGYSSNDDRFCSFDIPLAKVCDWQYGSEGHTFVMESGPYSGRCLNAKKKQVGGIKDMAGYCRDHFKPSSQVETTIVGGTWVCRTAIDMDLACSWQYQERDVEARHEGVTWLCYR